MARGSDAAHAQAELAWVGLGVRDEVRKRRRRNRRMHDQSIRLTTDARDRDDVVRDVEFELLVERCVDHVRRAERQQRVTIRWRAHDQLGADGPAGTWPVLDNKLMAETFRQPLADQPSRQCRVGRRRQRRRRCAPAVPDRLAQRQRARATAALPRSLPDAENADVEGSWHALRSLQSPLESALILGCLSLKGSGSYHKRIIVLFDDIICIIIWVTLCS